LNEAQASKEEKSATATKAHEAETETSATEPVNTVSQTEAQQLVLKKSDKEQEPKASKQRGEPKIPNPNYGNEACSEASRSGNSNYPITNLPTYPIQTGPIQMMSDLEKLIANHLVCTESQRVILALWILHTYTCEATPLTPYLNISSPLEESGKSTCMTILRGLCADPWWPVGLTPANFQRKINEDHPTVLLDNWQTLFRGTDRNKITGFLLSGCDQPPDFNDGDEAGTEAYPSDSNSGAETCAEDDSNYPITNLPNYPIQDAFCPKAFAGLEPLPATLARRSIPIVLQRPKPHEQTQPARQLLRPRNTRKFTSWMETFAGDHFDQIQKAFEAYNGQRQILPGLSPHQQDSAKVMIALAETLGGPWPQKARNLDERTWSEFSKGEPMTAQALAKMLGKFYNISPRSQRRGKKEKLRGYQRSDFLEAWERYLPQTMPAAAGEVLKTSIKESPAIQRDQRSKPGHAQLRSTQPVSQPIKMRLVSMSRIKIRFQKAVKKFVSKAAGLFTAIRS
jgi:hypothetical protein